MSRWCLQKGNHSLVTMLGWCLAYHVWEQITGGSCLMPLPYCSSDSAHPQSGAAVLGASPWKCRLSTRRSFQTQNKVVALHSIPEYRLRCWTWNWDLLQIKSHKLMVKLLRGLYVSIWSPLLSVKKEEGVFCIWESVGPSSVPAAEVMAYSPAQTDLCRAKPEVLAFHPRPRGWWIVNNLSHTEMLVPWSTLERASSPK